MYQKISALEEELESLLPPKRQLENGVSKASLPAAIKWSDAVWQKAEELGALSFTEKQIEQALQFKNNAVFICGTHRSGTTLLRDLLDDHPLLSVLPSEGSFLTNHNRQLLQLPASLRCGFMCREWLRRLANPINQSPYWLLGRSSQEQSPYVDFARTFISWWNFFVNTNNTKNKFWPLIVLQVTYAFFQNKNEEHLKYKYWVDKTPGNEYYLPLIWQQFPEAKIIHIIRNPVNILASRKRLKPPASLRNFIRGIQKSFKVAADQQIKKDQRYLVIKYEDLCNNPSASMQALASFLDIKPLLCLLQPTVTGKPAQPNSSFKSGLEYGKILSVEEHSGEEIVYAKELQLLSAAVDDSAIKFGYALPSVSIWQKFFLKISNRL